jgi:hypothetical protein
MPELTGVGTFELLSWQSGIELVRTMASRLDHPAEAGARLNSCEATVTTGIGLRRSR